MDATDFFTDKSYTADVVDVLVQVAADALKVNIMVYQKHAKTAAIQVLKHACKESDKYIYLKFTYNKEYPSENHYDSIVITQRARINKIVQILNEKRNEFEPGRKKGREGRCCMC